MRRAWLLAELGGVLERCARDRDRLLEVLALDDDRLLAALAGSRVRQLRERYERFDVHEWPRAAGVDAVCRHAGGYPPALSGPAAPRMLEVAGGLDRLGALTRPPVVAILGANAPSDYGVELARSLARGLTAAGVSVVACLRDGVGAAAHAGVLEAGGGGVAVLAGGLDVAVPTRRRALYARIKEAGCAISELPLGCRGRRWGSLASERVAVELASVTVVVEARESAEDLFGARIAQARGRTLAATPGRVSSPLSRGTHALLMDGARLVRGALDVFELLAVAPPPRPGDRMLAPRLHATLERVRAGADTPEKLGRSGEDPWELLSELSELELRGLLVRGDGGRYLSSGPC
ncbi:MAG TPA: DNA-processing protein DprA [Solirubrobacteraceae bacterium]|jgi:DNA processing protein|nr:DNA-processing protein DprA [Solirubrobacteraceae bacterium]